jgi:signal transduction histidine kinase
MSTANVLIVDDDQNLASELKQYLVQAGYGVSAIATSVREALHHAAHDVPDIVLINMQLQDGDSDGVVLASQLRHHFALPIVYVTRSQGDTSWQPVRHTDPYGYIFVPLQPAAVLATLETALARCRSESNLRSSLEDQHEAAMLHARLMSVLSHELRNPLNAILFSSELLQRYGNDISQEKKANYFQRIHLAVKRINQLLEDLMVMGAGNAADLVCHCQLIDLLQFCQDLIQEFQGVTNAEIHFHPAPSIATLVELDEKLLRHILTNLLSNAVKYSPQGATLGFTVTLDAQSARFAIQDQGIGIPAADRDHLFDWFYRGSNAQRIPGTGLGLSIVKHCVDLHGGTIAVESEPGRGSTFIVTLPIDQAVHLSHDNYSGD